MKLNKTFKDYWYSVTCYFFCTTLVIAIFFTSLLTTSFLITYVISTIIMLLLADKLGWYNLFWNKEEGEFL